MTVRRLVTMTAWLIVLAAPRGASAEWLYALTNHKHLGVFEASDPTQLIAEIPVRGLAPSERLLAIDFRPRDGQLYAIAVRPDDQPTPNYRARLYRVHMLNGEATPLGTTPLPLDPGVSSGTITITSDVTRELTYVLAEGATGGFFDLDILLANPGAIPTTVMLTFLREDGTTVNETRTLPPTSRTTVRVDEIPGLEAASMSTVVTSPEPIVVERTMRWAEGADYGAHTEKAVDGAAETWYFAEGSQGFFSTYLLLANPLKSENTATVEYLREGEPPVTRTYTLPPRSRTTIDASTDDELVNRSFGMTVTFAQPGVAERAMYFRTEPFWKAAHESAGVTLPSTTWLLAEGATGPFFETFVLLSNPQATPAEVTLTFLIAGGTPVTKTKTVPARGRLTVNIEQEDPALANVAVATQSRPAPSGASPKAASADRRRTRRTSCWRIRAWRRRTSASSSCARMERRWRSGSPCRRRAV